MTELQSPTKKRKGISKETAEQFFVQVSQQHETELAYLEKILLPEQLKPLLLHFEHSRKQLQMQLASQVQDDEEEDVFLTPEVVRAKTLSKVNELLNPEQLRRLIGAIMSEDNGMKLFALKGFNTLLSICDVYKSPLDRLPVAETFVKVFETIKESKVVPFIVECTKPDNISNVQIEALKVLNNFAPGPRIAFTPRDSQFHPLNVEFKRIIISLGVVPCLVHLIGAGTDATKVEALKCLCSLARHAVEGRDFLLQAGVVAPVLELFSDMSKKEVVREATQLLSLFSKSSAVLSGADTIMPIIDNILRNVSDDDTLKYALSILSAFCANVQTGILVRIVELMSQASSGVQQAALQTITDIFSTGNQALIMVLLDKTMLPHILKISQSKNEAVLSMWCTTICTFASVKECIQPLVDHDLVRELINMVTSGSHKIRVKATEVLRFISRGTVSQIGGLILNADFVTLLVKVMERWKLVLPQADKPPVFELGLARAVLEIFDNIMSLSPLHAQCFTRACIDRLLSYFVDFSVAEESEIALYRNEFLAKISTLLTKISDGYNAVGNAGVRQIPTSLPTGKGFESLSSVQSRATAILGLIGSDALRRPSQSGVNTSLLPQGSSMNVESVIDIKTYYQNDNRVFAVPRTVQIGALRSYIAQMYQLRSVSVQYRDEDGDLITIASQPALEIALQRTERAQTSVFGSSNRHGSLKLLVRVNGDDRTMGSMTPSTALKQEAENQRVLYDLLLNETHFGRQELANMLEFWKNRSKDGTIGRLDLETGFRTFMNIADPTVIEQTFKAFDIDGDGHLQIKEVILGLSALKHGSLDERIQLAFRAYDEDRSGYITKDEVRNIFLSSMRTQGQIDDEMIDAMVDHLFETVDVNKDGKLSFEEFKQGVLSGNITNCFGL